MSRVEVAAASCTSLGSITAARGPFVQTARPYTIQQLADDAAAVLDALEIERAHVLGLSMGATSPRRLRSAVPS
jgi:pimeloyl-ACP methyl ester carboxylesterase